MVQVKHELTAIDIWDKCWSELGRSLVYMQYLHTATNWEPQRSRVIVLCERLHVLFGKASDCADNRAILAQFLSEIQDDIENQC